MPQSSPVAKKIARNMLTAFIVVSVLAASIIWFSLDAASMVKRHSTHLIKSDIPKLEVIDKVDKLLNQEIIRLYTYYATTQRESYVDEFQRLRQEHHTYINTLKSLDEPPPNVEQFLEAVEQFSFHAWMFDEEMQTEDQRDVAWDNRARDWDMLREILADAQASAKAAREILVSWRHDILVQTQASSKRSLDDVAHMSDLLLLISVVIVITSAYVLFSLHGRLKDRDALYRMAYFDPRTGLSNVSSLQQDLESAVERGEQGYFMLLKLTRTQLLYATYGPELVDDARFRVSQWLQQTVAQISAEIEVYQVSEDCWGIRDQRQQNQVDCLRLIESLLRLQHEPLNIGDLKINVSCQIGATCYPQDGNHFRELYRNAVAAVQGVNETGGEFSLYNKAMLDRYQRWVDTDAAIRQALLLDQFELFYQPKVRGEDKQIASAEALIRWHRDGNWVSPGEFIPVAEQSGLIIPLGAWVLEAVCKQIQDWQRRGVALVPIALNISAQQYQDEGFVELVANKLQQYDIAPELIELEITEEVAANNPEHVINTMQRLKEIGVRIALDDFGTGYSSLSYLKRFPIDTMKIDRSFVGEMDSSSDSAAIVELILALADQLGYCTVAEGVETEAQAERLAEQGCDLLQGFLFSRPVAVAQFEDMLTRGC